MSKYAVKVNIAGKWQYVREGLIDDMRISVMSLEDAQEVVRAWCLQGSEDHIEIVEYSA